MLLDEECKDCLFNSQLKKVQRERGNTPQFGLFVQGVKSLCQNPPKDYCAPLLMRDINSLHRSVFGADIDYTREKLLFNGLLMEMEDELLSRIQLASDPLTEALKYAMASNYIDFARLADLNESAVQKVISAAERAVPDENTVNKLKEKLGNAKTLAYFHDNCGEIVLDKILIKVIKRKYRQIKVTSVVRGSPIINDVTEEDAAQTGLNKVAKVVSNGSDVPGTYLKEVSSQTVSLLKYSDVIISKGLGNLETLYGEGFKNVFYVFTCKCNHIAARFGTPLWSAVIADE